MKKELCQNWKLYVITDCDHARGRDLCEIVEAALQGGASVIQLRDKKARDPEMIEEGRKLRAVTDVYGVSLIVNDRIEVAKAIQADGVHLGQEDRSLKEARAILGEEAIVGRSTHSPRQATLAAKEGFDYIGVGPVFKTPTKAAYEPVGLELVRFAAGNVRIPFVAIGGIDETNVGDVCRAGAKTIAVVRAVMDSADPKKAAQRLRKVMGS